MTSGILRREGAFVVIVLIASVAVAGMLAFQAISAARSRQAVTNAMLRQYAELAAWEFSRAARRDIGMSLTRTLAGYVHPQQHAKDPCDCGALSAIDYWFEIGPDGAVVERSGPIAAAEREAIARHAAGFRGGSPDDAPRLLPLAGDRFVALRAEPHTTSGGAQIGLVTRVDALQPLLARTYERTVLLPAVVVDNRKSHELVHLQVEDARRRHVVFASPGTTAARVPMASASMYPDATLGLRIRASMTPAFVAALGPEHGGGPNLALIGGLVIVNVLMVAVGLWQLRRERELARLREDFVAGVSHELRTPLAQIRMFTETLLLDRVRNPVEGRRALEIIGQETRRLSQLVENVLYFHRHRRAPVAPPGAAMDLSTFVLQVTEGFKPLAASKRARLALNIPAHDVIAVASADGLRQVLLNLLDNAVKFGPPDSTVTVSLRPENGIARISVEDEGPGVPVADRRRIFEPFERGKTRAAGGAGIGLAVVHQIVTEHGGRVSVEDAPAGGARFVVELPAA